MSFKSLNIKPCYESGVDDIVEDFYAPVLAEARRYDRIAGFFSSSSLAVVARGMADFITNGGKMRLICSPVLNPNDYEIIEKIVSNGEIKLKDLGINFDAIVNEFEMNHVKALGWLLAQGRLEIKLALVAGDDGSMMGKETLFSMGLFHQKVGILTDTEGNRLSFSGSINETAAAWINNDEEFKVFKEWEGLSEYFEKDVTKFENLWNGNKKNVQVFNLPDAVAKELVKYGRDFDNESISLAHYLAHKVHKSDFEHNSISLFYYQNDALRKWKKTGYSMLFEMATGTGKTRTAIAGMNYLFNQHERMIAVIACPQNTLARQWKGEVAAFDLDIDEEAIVDGTTRDWEGCLKNILLKNGAGFADHCIIYTTHATASSDKFISIIECFTGLRTELLLIGDEVHWLGAAKLRKALLAKYKYRIGLSATPSRWFDDRGTRLLEEYFGNNHFEFTIRDALTQVNPSTGKHFLVNYYYKMQTIGLTEDEGLEYTILTDRIAKLSVMKDNNPEIEEKYTRLLEKRADIIKNAANKMPAFEKILDQLKTNDELDNLIIFVSPQQRETVLQILQKKEIIAHQLTQEEGTKIEKRYGGISERQHIIRLFKQGFYKALVAIKCLDEGIDIPTASRGILLSSSTNPREYVQRIGRIIRQSPDKTFAYLYDICVDSVSSLDGEYKELEAKIRLNEQRRLYEIAANAINAVEATINIFNL